LQAKYWSIIIAMAFNNNENATRPLFGTAGTPISSPSRQTQDGIRRVRELGLDALEVEFVRGVRMSEETARETARVAEELNVSLSVHAPYYVNLNGNPEVVKSSIQRIEDSCRVGAILGATVIVVHAAYYGKTRDSDAATNAVVGALQKVENHGVRIGLETMGRHSQWGTVDEIITAAEQCDNNNVVPVVDWAHIHARSGGGLRTLDDFRKVYERIAAWNKAYAKRLHSHFSGVMFTEKSGERNHLTIDSRSPDYAPLAKLIKSERICPTMISESPNIEGDAILFKKMWNDAVVT